MFDIDYIKAEARINLTLSKQDCCFIEYRTDFLNADVRFVAMFEIKFKSSDYVKEAIKCPVGTATFAQKILCKKLGMRYFIVVQTEGKLPFSFVEIKDTSYKFLGKLNEGDNIETFWKEILQIE
jgi:hypothetical protein